MDAHNKILSSAHVRENNYESKWEDLKVFNACTHRNVKTSLKERFNNGFVNIKNVRLLSSMYVEGIF